MNNIDVNLHDHCNNYVFLPYFIWSDMVDWLKYIIFSITQSFMRVF